jgi:hypothetical protein
MCQHPIGLYKIAGKYAHEHRFRGASSRMEELNGPGTYFRFRQNVQDSCGLNLCLLDFVSCCDWAPSTGGPLSDVGVACMADERTKCDRPREFLRWRLLHIRDEREKTPLIRLKQPLLRDCVMCEVRGLEQNPIARRAAVLLSNERVEYQAFDRDRPHLYPTVRPKPIHQIYVSMLHGV